MGDSYGFGLSSFDYTAYIPSSVTAAKQKLEQSATALGTAIQNGATSLSETASSLAEDTIDKVEDTISTGVSMASNTATAIKSKVSSSLPNPARVEAVQSSVTDYLRDKGVSLSTAISNGAEAVADAVQEVETGLSSSASKVIEGSLDVAETTSEVISDGSSSVLDASKKVGSAIKDSLSEGAEMVAGVVSEAERTTKETVSTISKAAGQVHKKAKPHTPKPEPTFAPAIQGNNQVIQALKQEENILERVASEKIRALDTLKQGKLITNQQQSLLLDLQSAQAIQDNEKLKKELKNSPVADIVIPQMDNATSILVGNNARIKQALTLDNLETIRKTEEEKLKIRVETNMQVEKIEDTVHSLEEQNETLFRIDIPMP